MNQASSYIVIRDEKVTIGGANAFNPDTFKLPSNARNDERSVLGFRVLFTDADDFQFEVHVTGQPIYGPVTVNNADNIAVLRDLQFVVPKDWLHATNDNILTIRKLGGDGTLTYNDVVLWFRVNL